MSENSRRRYRVRLRRAVAGSFLTAASAAALAGMTAAPALAVATSSITAAATFGGHAGDAVHEPDTRSAVGLVADAGFTADSPTAAERLAGVRSDLDRAVLLRLVTPEQADGFYAQIQRRIAGGL